MFFPKINYNYEIDHLSIEKIYKNLSNDDSWKNIGENKWVFTPKLESYIIHNSFIPIIELNIARYDKKNKIYASCNLMKSVKIFFAFYCIVACIFQMMLWGNLFINNVNEVNIIVSHLPLILLTIAYLISYIFMYIYSKKILNNIFKLL